MRKYLRAPLLKSLIFCFFVVLSGCQKEQSLSEEIPTEDVLEDDINEASDDRKIISGTWKQVSKFHSVGSSELYFVPVESDKTLVFKEEGLFSVRSGALCYDGNTPISLDGRFIIKNKKIVFLDKDTCSWDEVFFEIKGDDLFIYLPTCIDGCGEKFVRVK